MSFRAFINTFRQPLKKASGEYVNKVTKIDINNLATRFQLSWLFDLSAAIEKS